jgi:flagellar biosynthetic protein FliO
MIKGVLLSAIGILCVCVFIVYPQDSVQEKSGGIGNFSIEKVRDLSANPASLTAVNDSVSPVKKAAEKGAADYTIIMLRIIGSLVLIIALIYLVTWLMRKFGLAGTSTRVGGGGGSMDVLEVLPLGQNRNAVLFRVMDTVYLCGQTQTNIALIDKIEGPRAAEILTSSKGTSTVVHFKEAVNHFISRMKK